MLLGDPACGCLEWVFKLFIKIGLLESTEMEKAPWTSVTHWHANKSKHTCINLFLDKKIYFVLYLPALQKISVRNTLTFFKKKKEVKNIYIWSDCNRWPTHIQFKLCGKSGANQHVFSPKLQKDKQRQHSKLIWQVSNNYRQDTMVCPAVSEWKENKPWKEVFSYAMWYLDSSAIVFPLEMRYKPSTYRRTA